MLWNIHVCISDPTWNYKLTNLGDCEIGFMHLDTVEFFCAEFNRRKVDGQRSIEYDYADVERLWINYRELKAIGVVKC